MPKLSKLAQEELMARGGHSKVRYVKKVMKDALKGGNLSQLQVTGAVSAMLYHTNGKDAFKV